MSGVTVYDSEGDLREALADVNNLLNDFKATQHTLDAERAVLAEQVQGAMAEMEKRVSEYEVRRDDVDRRMGDLVAQRKPFEETRDRLQQQLDAKQDAKLGRTAASADAGRQINEGNNASQSIEPHGIVTKADIEKLEAQRTKPQPALTLDPPGGISQAAAVDRDLKLKTKIDQKQERLDGASQNLRENWNQSVRPKR